MTISSMPLADVLEKYGSRDFLREMLELVLQRLMEAEVEQRCNAGLYERSDERTNQRNGSRDRRLETGIGTLQLQVPKLRKESYFPSFLEPRRISERALVSVVQQAYVHGVSTRKVDDLVQALGMSGISKSQVSRLCSELDERVSGFLDRPLEGVWPYVWLDATYLKSRDDGHVRSRAVVVAVGVNTSGRREVLGVGVGPAETEMFWLAFLRKLVARGLSGTALVVSDAHTGLKTAVERVLSTTWQRCRVHFMRNVLAHVPGKQHTMVASLVRTIFAQENKQQAHAQWREVADTLRSRFPKAAEVMDGAEDDVLAFMDFPAEHRRQLHSTNPLERLNKEIKRRSNVVGIFPNDNAITRLVGALMMEQNDEWHVSRRYMSMEGLRQVTAADEQPPLAKLAGGE